MQIANDNNTLTVVWVTAETSNLFRHPVRSAIVHFLIWYKHEIWHTDIVVTNTSIFRYSAKPELRRFPQKPLAIN